MWQVKWMSSVLVAFLALHVGNNEAQGAECLDPGIDSATLLEMLDKDAQVRGMRPWSLVSIDAACLQPDGLIALSLVFGSSERSSGLGVQYTHRLALSFDPVKGRAIAPTPVLTKRRSEIEKSMRSAERDGLVKSILGSVPEEAVAEAVVEVDGRITYEVASWGRGVQVSWSGEEVTQFVVPWEVEIRAAQVSAFKMVQLNMVDGKTCDPPSAYAATLALETRTWSFDFDVVGECSGKWRLEMAMNGEVSLKKR